jgi:hypothetical protein
METNPDIVHLYEIGEYECDRVLEGPFGTELRQRADHAAQRELTWISVPTGTSE